MRLHKIKLLYAILFLSVLQLGCDEQKSSSNSNFYSILQFQTKIKHYNGTMNSGMISTPQNNGYILAFHKDIDLYTPKKYYQTQLNFLFVNNKFKTKTNYQVGMFDLYDFGQREHWKVSTAQDPRLFAVNEQYYMLYNDAVHDKKRREMFLAKINVDKSQLQVSELQLLEYAPGKRQDQKNWMPLVYNNDIYFIYSIDPHIVLRLDKDQLHSIPTLNNNIQSQWPYGIIRGGTPAVYVNDLNGYLAFFHSSLPYKPNEPEWKIRQGPPWRIYYMGAIVFDNKPPFKIKAFTKKPLTFPGLYSAKNTNYQIIFPSGLVEQESKFLLSAGYQDAETIILSVNKQDLYKYLTTIN